MPDSLRRLSDLPGWKRRLVRGQATAGLRRNSWQRKRPGWGSSGLDVGAACGGFHLVAACDKDAASVDRGISALPEVTWDMLAAGLDVGDRAATECDQRSQIRLSQASRAPIGG